MQILDCLDWFGNGGKSLFDYEVYHNADGKCGCYWYMFFKGLQTAHWKNNGLNFGLIN